MQGNRGNNKRYFHSKDTFIHKRYFQYFHSFNISIILLLIFSTILFKSTTLAQEVDDCWDLYACCSFWASRGRCGSEYMNLVCSRSCNRCQLTRTSSDQNCIDHFTNCHYWSTVGYCTKNRFWMEENCRRSCSQCHLAKSTGCPAEPYGWECHDQDPCCEWYSRNHGCTTDYMRNVCQVACNTCRSRWPKPDACLNHFALCKRKSRHGQCRGGERVWMEENCRDACGLCTVPKNSGCPVKPPEIGLTSRPGTVPGPVPAPRPRPLPRPVPAPVPRPPRPRGPPPAPPAPGQCTEFERCEQGTGCDESCEGRQVCSSGTRSFILVRPNPRPGAQQRNSQTKKQKRKKRQSLDENAECTCRCLTGYYRELNNAFSPCVPFQDCHLVDTGSLEPLSSSSAIIPFPGSNSG